MKVCYLSINLSIKLSINQSIYLSKLSIHPSIHLCIYLSILSYSILSIYQVVVCYLSIYQVADKLWCAIYQWLPSSYQCLLHSGQYIMLVVLYDVITSTITILNQICYEIEMISYKCIQQKESSICSFK